MTTPQLLMTTLALLLLLLILLRRRQGRRVFAGTVWTAPAELALAIVVVGLAIAGLAGNAIPPGAVSVDVVAEDSDGRRITVSHFNKAHKGRLARALSSSRSEPTDAAAVAALARRAKMRVERRGNHLTVVVAA